MSFDPSIGTEIKKTRPALIISNDISNRFSKRVQVIPATSKINKLYPSECYIKIKNKTVKLMADQIMTVFKERLSNKIGEITDKEIEELERVLALQLGMNKS